MSTLGMPHHMPHPMPCHMPHHTPHHMSTLDRQPSENHPQNTEPRTFPQHTFRYSAHTDQNRVCVPSPPAACSASPTAFRVSAGEGGSCGSTACTRAARSSDDAPGRVDTSLLPRAFVSSCTCAAAAVSARRGCARACKDVQGGAELVHMRSGGSVCREGV
eukprot:29023-Pelagomonas_calceolata.AAC.4